MEKQLMIQMLALGVLLCVLGFNTSAYAETIMVPMRDGAKLATDVSVPSAGGPSFPVVLIRTVYGRKDNGMLSLAGLLNSVGLVVVIQDTRGHGESEGEKMGFTPDGWGECQDGADTIEWVKKQSWCNGKIGTWGSSALGITQVLMAPVTSSITCQAIIMAPSNFYHVFLPGGVPQKALAERYAKIMGHQETLAVQRTHPSYDDYWKLFNAETRAHDITAPAVHISGWYDLYPQGTLNNFTTRQYHGGPGAKGNQKLIMGPWTHNITQKVGDLTFPDNYTFDWENYVWRFFRYWLQEEQNGIMDEPAVHYYVMGDCDDPNAPGNEWRTATDWPPYPTKETAFYLNQDKSLTPAPPDIETAALSYDFDPANPCPSLGGTSFVIPGGPMDQRPISSRADVLAFATKSLNEPVEISGAVQVRLFVSTDAPDTDFTAKLIDIYPDGKEIAMADGIQRVKFRNGFEKAEPLEPGTIGELTIDLWSISLVFNKGHKIGVQVSSSNFPRCEVNPNTGQDLPRYSGENEAGDMLVAQESVRSAHNTVYMDKAHPSMLILPARVGEQEKAVATSLKDDYALSQEKKHTDLTFDKVSISPTNIPAYVIYMRAKTTDIKPAMLLLHGGAAGDADKTQLIEWGWPIELARMGYLVVCTDGWGCGEHSSVKEGRNKENTGFWEIMANRFGETGKDCSHVYDYLSARPDVDPKRIGVMGVSAGAMSAFAAAINEERFSAYVAINGSCDYFSPQRKDTLTYKLYGGATVFENAPDDTRARVDAIDPINHVDKLAPKPLLIVHGNFDQMAPAIFTEKLYDLLKPLYKDAPEKLARKTFDVYPLPSHRQPDITELAATYAFHQPSWHVHTNGLRSM